MKSLEMKTCLLAKRIVEHVETGFVNLISKMCSFVLKIVVLAEMVSVNRTVVKISRTVLMIVEFPSVVMEDAMAQKHLNLVQLIVPTHLTMN